MAGHSKWANIKHKKAKEDSKRGKIFTKLIKEISVVAREGGGNPDNNPRLRLLLEKAREANMPQENTMRAIKRGTGELPGVNYEEQLYEGYGPHGIAIIVEALTDNKNRTVAELRRIFSSKGGNIGSDGVVSWMFERMGVVHIKNTGLNEDDLLEKLIDFDVTDIKCEKELCSVFCDAKAVGEIKKAIEQDNMHVESAQLEWVAKTTSELSDAQAEKALELLSALQDHDDVQNVYTNLV